ncbi:MAG: hypothetical protein ACPG8A_07535 [Psychrobium sp.]
MSANFLLYAVFASQIFVISYLLPTKLHNRAKSIMAKYPADEYGKLYPISVEEINRKICNLVLFSQVVLGIGVGIIVHGLYSQSAEMLGWDSQSVIMIYYMLQIAPLVMLAMFSERYFNKMRALNSETVRRASLSPRKFANYAPMWLIASAVTVYLFYIGLVAYVVQNPFDGFAGGLTNILGVTGLNVFFGFIAYRAVYGVKKDPHQTDEDRFKQASRIVKLMLFGSIAATVNISIHFVLSAMDLRHLNDVVSSVYFQGLMLVVILAVLNDDSNFEVYKNQTTNEGVN